MSHRIAILGGGIAGLGAAIALAQRGVSSTVFERRGSPTTLGAGLVCWPNACFVLRELGVLEMLRNVAGKPTAMARWTAKGELLGRISIADIERSAGDESLAVLRSDLHRVLRERANELGVVVEYNHRAVHVASRSTGEVEIAFERGARHTVDLVIGAEGRMTSAARAFVLGHSKPVYQGFVNWIGVLASDEPVFVDSDIKDIWGVGKRFGIVPISERLAYWAAAEAQEEPRPVPQQERQAHLCQLFQGWPAPVETILRSTSAAECHEVHVYDHDPVSRWHRDSVLLIGDAAHAALPTSGQGACQALEDAWYLAHHLGGCNHANEASIESALKNFTDSRLDKTSQITQAGRHLARSLFATDVAKCEVRDAAARNADYRALAEGMGRFWAQGVG